MPRVSLLTDCRATGIRPTSFFRQENGFCFGQTISISEISFDLTDGLSESVPIDSQLFDVGRRDVRLPQIRSHVFELIEQGVQGLKGTVETIHDPLSPILPVYAADRHAIGLDHAYIELETLQTAHHVP